MRYFPRRARFHLSELGSEELRRELASPTPPLLASTNYTPTVEQQQQQETAAAAEEGLIDDDDIDADEYLDSR